LIHFYKRNKTSVKMGIVESTIKNVLLPSFLTTPSTRIDKLPPEILMKIFSMLNNKDLGNVVSVCSRWRDVGECLWSWDILVIAKNEIEMMRIKRVEHVEDLLLEYDEDWSEEELTKLFESISRLPKLSSLSVDGISLTSLSPSLLVEAVMNIASVDLSFCELSVDQLNMLFDEIDENVQLKYLEMKGVDMSCVNMYSLAAGVNQLDFANLFQTQLSMEQVTALLRESGMQTNLIHLDLDSNTIEGDPILHRVDGDAVDPELVKKAKKNINNINLKYDFDNNPHWSTYKAGKIVCYVTGQ